MLVGLDFESRIKPHVLVKSYHSLLLFLAKNPETRPDSFFAESASRYIWAIATYLSNTSAPTIDAQRPSCTPANVLALALHDDYQLVLEVLKSEPKAYAEVQFLSQALQQGAATQVALIMNGLHTSLSNIAPGTAARERAVSFLLAARGQA